MNELSSFIPNDADRLFGVQHSPWIGNGWGILFCYPFGEERIRVHRLLVNYARILQEQGFTVLRFDYRGYGDSDGEFRNVTVSTQQSDIGVAASHLRQAPGVERLALLGIRFGATLAAVAANTVPAVSKLVLWEPVINVREFLYGKLRVNLSTQSTSYRKIVYDRDQLVSRMHEGIPANIDGYEMCGEFYREACSINLMERDCASASDVLLVGMQPDKKECRLAVEGWGQRLGQRCRSLKVDMVQSPPVWELLRNYHPRAEELFSCTSAWLAGEGGK
ncbi:MAG: serine aminopeptidase domain-containing protein [Candidatus Geothermincolia bacterium]